MYDQLSVQPSAWVRAMRPRMLDLMSKANKCLLSRQEENLLSFLMHEVKIAERYRSADQFGIVAEATTHVQDVICSDGELLRARMRDAEAGLSPTAGLADVSASFDAAHGLWQAVKNPN